MSATGEATLQRVEGRRPGVLRGLLWQEWLAHGERLCTILVSWVVCAWVLMVFYHPGYILAFGALVALYLGQALGGALLLALTGLGALSIGFDLPQKVWGLVVESGFTEPFAPCRPRFLYALSVCAPAAAFSFSFTLAALARSRELCSGAGLAGGLVTAVVTGAGFVAEWQLWGELNGLISCPLLLGAAVAALAAGYAKYARKEGINRPLPSAERGGRRWLWWVALLVLIFLLLSGIVLFRAAPGPAVPTRAPARSD